ncbi:Spore germination protein YndE [Paenibacillus solanacearum]|uniref:Spore germination protein YndE n=1 Tax=Paenibacillus solanacearum TaxID=2048548 RepID=A0A916K6Q6_9BACL|nr:endospore germination permease [Paenibacillus solanacearum]CAG7637056.1 Spore germination protein YndE [Paenibacillus solanacearum]
MERTCISTGQLIILVIMHVVGTTILVIPSILLAEAKQDAWLAALIALVASVPLMLLFLALHSRYPTMTIVEMLGEVFGKRIGNAVSLLCLIVYPIYLFSLTLRNIGDFMTSQIMPETPIEVIHIVFMAFVLYAVRLGLEPIARAAELLIPIVILMLFVMFIFVTPQIKHENILPVLENGFKPVFRAAIPFFSFPFMEGLLFLMILPQTNQQAKAGKAYVTGVAIGWAILFILTVLIILVLGTSESTLTNIFPTYDLAKKINVGRFFERVEITVAIAWFITSFFRVCLYLYCTAYGIAQALQLKEYRMLAAPIAILVVVFSLLAVPNPSYLRVLDVKILPFFNLTFGLIFPLILYVVALFRKPKGNPS